MRCSIIALVVASTIISGCSTFDGLTKQQIGTGIGAAVGLGVGAFVGGGNGKIAAMAVGTLLGGVVGNSVGKQLDEQDRKDLAIKARQVIEQSEGAKAPQVARWVSPRSGAQAIVEATRAAPRPVSVKVRAEQHIITPKSFNVLDGSYVTRGVSMLRSGPGAQYDRVRSVAAHQAIRVVGEKDGWLMVAEQGKVVGYVRQDLVQSQAASRRTGENDDVGLSKNKDSAVILVSSSDLTPKTVPSRNSAPVELDFDSVTESQAMLPCKNVKIDVKSSSGVKDSNRFESCHAPGGEWVSM